MKKVVLFVVLLVVVGLWTPAAQAQFCFDFDAYCDGLEINVSGKNLSGFWKNTDCAGTDLPVLGIIKPLTSPCGGAVSAGIACADSVNGCSVGGSDWIFMIDALDGTMDMGNGFPLGTCWLDDLGYTLVMGSCVLAQDNGSRPKTSTTF